MSELRPSFEERDKYLRQLSVAYADGRLDDDEFQRRSDGVLGAVTHRDAMAMFEGLPHPNVAPMVPVNPPRPQPSPQPPAAFTRMPSPQVTNRGPSTNRRSALGFGVLGVAAVAFMGIFGFSTMRSMSNPFSAVPSDAATEWVTVASEPTASEAASTESWLWADWTSQVVADAQDQARLDSFTSFTVSKDGIKALGTSDRMPGLVMDLGIKPGGPTSIGQAVQGETERYVAFHEFDNALRTVVDDANMQFGAEPSQAELVFINGRPRVAVSVAVGSLTGVATYDMNGTLVSKEEPK